MNPGSLRARLDPRQGVSERNYGFAQEMAHLVDRVLNDKEPLVTGEDGRVAMEVILAAYGSARTGCRVTLPCTPPDWAHSPLHCWKPWLSPDCPDELIKGAG